MEDIELTSPSEVHVPSIEECIERIECLFKNSKGSDYNYQLNVKNSPWNILKWHIVDSFFCYIIYLTVCMFKQDSCFSV